jgi:predicted alpha-1,2-mannosidase
MLLHPQGMKSPHSRLVLLVLVLASAGCNGDDGKGTDKDPVTLDDGDGTDMDGADDADEIPTDGDPEDDGGTTGGMDAGLDGSVLPDGGDGDTDAAVEEDPPEEFYTSFETTDPQPTWNNSVETGTNGQPRQSGVTGVGNLIPGNIMDMVTSSSASAENAPSEGAAQGVDGDKTSKWLAFASTGWLAVELLQPVAVRRYALTSANDAPERDPRNWTLEGSDDGMSWTILDSQTNQTFQDRFVTKVYDFANELAFKRYRLSVTGIGSGSIVQLAELQLSDGNDGPAVNAPMTSEVGRGPGSSWNAKLNAGFRGVRALRYAGSVTVNGRGYAYNQVFDVDIEVAPKSELSYMIFPDEGTAAGYASTYAAVDLAFDDGTYLSELDARDEQFALLSPTGQGVSHSLVAGEWNHKVSRIGTVAAGKTIKRILVGYDHPDGPAAFGGWIDDLRIGGPLRKPTQHLADYVVTTRGTNSSGGYSRGNTIPATALPHGFNFWTPVTDAASQSWLYTYHRNNDDNNHTKLEALAMSHEPSPWMGDRQSFQVMPSRATGEPNASRTARALAFDHANEIARPHYYSVSFENGIKAEIAPTDHAAIMRFTFPTNDANLIFDNVTNEGGLTLSPEDNSISGFSDTKSWSSAGATRIFVYATFDKPIIANGMLNGGAGNNVTGYYRFQVDGTDRSVTMRIASSLIGVEQAKKNLALEIAEADTLETVRDRARAIWDDKLDVVKVEGANMDQLATLYSNLYRLFLYPNSGFENVGTAEAPRYSYASPVSAAISANTPAQTGARIVSGKIYVNNGFWDTFRSAWPAYALLTPEQAGELIDGFVQQYKDGGWVGRWSSPGYADLMTGTSSEVAFADAYLKGVKFDAKAAYDAALKSASVVPQNTNVGRKGNDRSLFLGYTSTETHEGLSWAMAGYLNDFGIGNLAKVLSQNNADARRFEYAEHAEYFLERSRNYVHLFDASVDFFRGRDRNGVWRPVAGGYDPRVWGHDYTESNGWNMAFDAPHDGQGLANLYGGRAALGEKLDEFFDTPETATLPGSFGSVIHEMIEARDVRMGQLALNNQVAYHIPYMYLYAGQPAKTQKLVREALSRMFVGSDIGQGYLGDEDNGALAAWQIFGALGIYPLQIGTPNYVFGSPLFTKATITLENGNAIVINAANNGPQNPYVQSLKVNGEAYTKTWISHDVLTGGAVLDFVMGPAASAWGSGANDAPPSLTTGNAAPNPLGDVTKGTTVTTIDNTNVANLFDDWSATRVTFPGANPTIEITGFSGGAADVKFYTLTSSTTAADPNGWNLYGSNDGVVWELLDQRSGQSFPWRSQTRAFKVAEPGSYTRYRLTLVSAPGASLAEVELLTTR